MMLSSPYPAQQKEETAESGSNGMVADVGYLAIQHVEATAEWRASIGVGDVVRLLSAEIESSEWLLATVMTAVDDSLCLSFQLGTESCTKRIDRASTQILPALGVSPIAPDKSPSRTISDSQWRKMLSIGSNVLLRSSDGQNWREGVVVALNTDMVKVQYFRGTGCCLKSLLLDSSDLAPAASTCEKWRIRLSVASLILVRCSGGHWQEGVVVSLNLKEVNVQFFREGRCCIKKMALDSCDLAPCRHNNEELEPQEDRLPVRFATTESASTTSSATAELLQRQLRTKFVDEAEIELQYITAAELSSVFEDDDLQVIDVRDMDYTTGHIPGGLHAPQSRFGRELPELLLQFADCNKRLVFHCMHSQHRGPSCARRFLSQLRKQGNSSGCSVSVLSGGYQAWQKHVQRPPDPKKQYIAHGLGKTLDIGEDDDDDDNEGLSAIPEQSAVEMDSANAKIPAARGILTSDSLRAQPPGMMTLDSIPDPQDIDEDDETSEDDVDNLDEDGE